MNQALPSVQFFVHASAADCCTAACVHRSGNRPLAIGFGDPVYDQAVTKIVGLVTSVDEVLRVTPDTWLYRVRYRPEPGTKHGYFTPLMYFGPLELGVNQSEPKQELQSEPKKPKQEKLKIKITGHSDASGPAKPLAATA